MTPRKPSLSTSGIGPRDRAVYLLIQARCDLRRRADYGEVPLRSACDAIDSLTHMIQYLGDPKNEGVA